MGAVKIPPAHTHPDCGVGRMHSVADKDNNDYRMHVPMGATETVAFVHETYKKSFKNLRTQNLPDPNHPRRNIAVQYVEEDFWFRTGLLKQLRLFFSNAHYKKHWGRTYTTDGDGVLPLGEFKSRGWTITEVTEPDGSRCFRLTPPEQPML
jgi:hypothetical protein